MRHDAQTTIAEELFLRAEAMWRDCVRAPRSSDVSMTARGLQCRHDPKKSELGASHVHGLVSPSAVRLAFARVARQRKCRH
jgi:hypothetical protein